NRCIRWRQSQGVPALRWALSNVAPWGSQLQSTLRQLLESLFADPATAARRGGAGFAPGRSHYGGGVSMPGKTQLAVGLDVGSSRTRCVICALQGDHLRCLSYGLAVSSGWTKGRITDQV